MSVDRQRPKTPHQVAVCGGHDDAAHAMTPNLGQGGCMAIEDALVLTRCLRGTTDVAQAPDPDWHYIIVSLRQPEPVLRSYRIADGNIEEEPVVLIDR